jgi:hypothetical protein
LGYILGSGFDFLDLELRKLFKAKLAEDGFQTGLEKYRKNLGRTADEIKDMETRIETELLEVLTLDARKRFSLSKTLRDLNKALRDLK